MSGPTKIHHQLIGLHRIDLEAVQQAPEREREKTARKTGHSDNQSENKRRRGGEGIELVDGVEEVENYSVVVYVDVPSSLGLQQHSYAKG